MYAPSNRNQSHDAQTLYDARSAHYDESWHPRFTRHMVELAKVQPGERILDLACGTGLCTFAAAAATGPTGHVVGIDVSSGMLAQARRKLDADPGMGNVLFYRHSISELDTLEALRVGELFDVVFCCSALVLFEDPVEIVKGWMRFLRPGGRVIVDVTHPLDLAGGVTMERVGRELGKPVPYYRLNFQTPKDLVRVMKAAGVGNVHVKCVSQVVDQGTDELEAYLCELDRPVVVKEYDIGDADKIFEAMINAVAFEALRETEDVQRRAKKVFELEWAGIADADGKVKDVDMVFVGIGTKK